VKLKIKLTLFIALYLLVTVAVPKNASAISTPDVSPGYRDETLDHVTITWSGLNIGSTYYVCFGGGVDCGYNRFPVNKSPDSGNKLSIDICGLPDYTNIYTRPSLLGFCTDIAEQDRVFRPGSYDVLLYDTTDSNAKEIPGSHANFDVWHYYPNVSVTPTSPKIGDTLSFHMDGTRRPYTGNCQKDVKTAETDLNNYQITLKDQNGNDLDNRKNYQVCPTSPMDFNFDKAPLPYEGDYTINVEAKRWGSDNTTYFTFYTIKVHASNSGGSIQIVKDPNNIDHLSDSGGSGFGSGRNPCGATCQTAFGPIPVNLKGFSTQILSVATGIAGGIAFILMVIGAIRILTSQGDPKNVAGGREMIVAAVAGLLFLIFSVILLRFVGINLLGGVTGL
jgi:hypothetical protein